MVLTERKMSKEESKGKLALVRIRGLSGVKKQIDDNMKLLKLFRKNYCVVVDNNETYAGMCRKAKDFITWGEIDDETYKLLKEKRGQVIKDKSGKDIERPFFTLHPPRKGYGKKGIKVNFKIGGALGYRGSKINDLIQRMI